MTRDELRNRISAKEFLEWTRYYAVQAQQQELDIKRESK